MKNDTGSRISTRHVAAAVRGGVLVCFSVQVAVAPIAAFAEVGLPPPAAHQNTENGFPSSQALKNQGYDPKRGVLRVEERNRGAATVGKSGGEITGKQPKSVTVTGQYGEKATIGTTATQSTSISKLNTAANAVFIASVAGQNQTENANKLGGQIAKGDYSGAASTAVDMAGKVLDNLTGGIFKGVADGYSGLSDLRKAADSFNKSMYGNGGRTSANANSSGQSSGQSAQNGQQSAAQQAAQLSQIGKQAAAAQRQAEARGDLAGAVGQAAAAKAANAAAAEAQKKEMHQDTVWRAGTLYGQGSKYGMTPEQACSGAIPGFPGMTYIYKDGACLATDGKNQWLWSVSKQVYTYTPSETFKQDSTLNDKDVKQILERMLENQNTNHQELMNQLAKMGNAVEQATTSREYTPSEAFSAPYTPQGSSTAQQTRFTIDKNGNVTATTVPRPDLKPNSSQAPTRTTIVPNKAQQGDKQGGKQDGQGQQSGQEQGQGQQKPTTPISGQQTPTNPTTGQQGQGRQTPEDPAAGQQQGQGQQTPTAPTTGQQIGGQPSQNQQQQQQKKFCEENPKAASCAELGEADYEDIQIPQSTIDLKLQPLDIFSTDGVCPANPVFSMGALGSFEIPYSYICNVARLLRPILILATIIGCSFFAYNAVKEL
uniref:Tspb protein n=1 Tax=Dulem virus 50 TaxID=3145761 RepID=A0AAU8B0Y8_9VIRU